jgi:hypothetical protein
MLETSFLHFSIPLIFYFNLNNFLITLYIYQLLYDTNAYTFTIYWKVKIICCLYLYNIIVLWRWLRLVAGTCRNTKTKLCAVTGNKLCITQLHGTCTILIFKTAIVFPKNLHNYHVKCWLMNILHTQYIFIMYFHTKFHILSPSSS